MKLLRLLGVRICIVVGGNRISIGRSIQDMLHHHRRAVVYTAVTAVSTRACPRTGILILID